MYSGGAWVSEGEGRGPGGKAGIPFSSTSCRWPGRVRWATSPAKKLSCVWLAAGIFVGVGCGGGGGGGEAFGSGWWRGTYEFGDAASCEAAIG